MPAPGAQGHGGVRPWTRDPTQPRVPRAAYLGDVGQFAEWLSRQGVDAPAAATSEHVRRWIGFLTTSRRAKRSIARKLASLRRYFGWHVRRGTLPADPTAGIRAPSDPGRLPRVLTAEQLEAALRAEVTRVAREGVSETELNRVKTQWVASEVYKLDSVMSQARELGVFWALGLPLDAGEQVIQRLRAVTAEQVKSVAQRYFGDDQLTVAVLRPQPMDGKRRTRMPPAASTASRH